MNRFYMIGGFKTRTYFNDPPVVPPVSPPPPPPPPPPVTTFTQEQVNKMLADNKRAVQQQRDDAIKQLEEVRNTVTLTQQQKEELDARIETLQQQHLTKEQQLAADLEKATKKSKAEIENLSGETKKWRSNFENMLVENAIITGATKHTAANAKQMQAMLSTQAKVVEEVDEKGVPTGKFVVKLPMNVIDPKTKQPVQVELEMSEAIGKMREDPDNANLFLTDGKPGLGGNNNGKGGGSGGTPNFATMTSEQYIEWRKANGYAGRR